MDLAGRKSVIDYEAIWKEVISGFRCELGSIHGPEHWHRVEDVGLKIAGMTGKPDVDVVRLFAVLHDSRRLDDYDDPEHGVRAAEYAKELRARLFNISNQQFGLLYRACCSHNKGCVTDDPTIGACWDADRMDLTRIGIEPDPSFISTPEVRRTLHSRR